MPIIRITSQHVEEYSLDGWLPSKFQPGEFYNVPEHVAFAMVRKGAAVPARAADAPMQGEPAPPPPTPAQPPAEQQQPAEQPKKGKRP